MKRVSKAIPALLCSTSLLFVVGCSQEPAASTKAATADVQPAKNAGTDVALAAAPAAAKPADVKAAPDRKPARDMAESAVAVPADEQTVASNSTSNRTREVQRVKPSNIRVEDRVKLNPDGSPIKDPAVRDRAARTDNPKSSKPDNSKYINPDAPVVVHAEPAQLFLGEVSTGDVGTGVIKLVNTGDKPMRLIECKSSCGCTTTNCPTGEEIPPGGFVELPVRMNAGAVPQESMSKTLTYIIEDHPMISVPVSAKIVSYIALDPEVLDTDVSLDGKITLRAIDNQPFVITSMIPPIITEFDTEPKAEQTVTIDWDKFVNSGYRGGSKLIFYTNHPKCRAAYGTVKGIKAREAMAKYSEMRNRNRGQTAPDLGAIAPSEPVSPDQFHPFQATLTAVDLRLHAFTKVEDVAGMKQAIADGANVKAPDANGKAPLHIAAAEGKVQAINTLVEAGADLEARDRGGRTPLMWAVEAHSADAVKRLIELGADLTARDDTGGTALMWAAGFGNPATLRAIIDAKADLKVTDDHGMTALMWAASFGDGERVKMLIDAGLDVNLVDGTRGCSALMYAARSSGPIESVKALINAGANVSLVDVTGRSALSWAALLGTPEKVQLLLDAGADATKEDFRGWTPLRYAENRRDRNGPMIVSLLKDATAKVGGEVEKSASDTDDGPIDPQARK